MEKANFEFNVKSEAYEERLRQEGHWEKFNLMRETAKNDLRSHDADYAAHRDQRIGKAAAEIAERQRLALDRGPAIGGGPVRRPLTAEQITAQATKHVDDAHKGTREELYTRHHTSINGFVRHALRIPEEFVNARAGWLHDLKPGGHGR